MTYFRITKKQKSIASQENRKWLSPLNRALLLKTDMFVQRNPSHLAGSESWNISHSSDVTRILKTSYLHHKVSQPAGDNRHFMFWILQTVSCTHWARTISASGRRGTRFCFGLSMRTFRRRGINSLIAAVREEINFLSSSYLDFKRIH